MGNKEVKPVMCYECENKGLSGCEAVYNYKIVVDKDTIAEADVLFRKKYPEYLKYWCKAYKKKGKMVYEGKGCKNCVREGDVAIFNNCEK